MPRPGILLSSAVQGGAGGIWVIGPLLLFAPNIKRTSMHSSVGSPPHAQNVVYVGAAPAPNALATALVTAITQTLRVCVCVCEFGSPTRHVKLVCRAHAFRE